MHTQLDALPQEPVLAESFFPSSCTDFSLSLASVDFHALLARTLTADTPKGWTIRIMGVYLPPLLHRGSDHDPPSSTHKPLPPMSRLMDFGAFKHPTYSLLAIGAWISIFSIFNPFFYVGLYGSVAFGESNLTSYYLAILCATSIVGRVGPGLIADRLGR